ncbi:hypothetical protein KTT_28220 [Tengunoibacter tsumagoiensis]|uniref:Uncharacterized protein n=1 Tax=Tengunoibacter tsumagoiensis TaxID=2014871 RepID=A0A402A1E8_9CHLR|nr:hypothetical protein KTT_28220 [Tengunoibacter tsumagoiensis]
MPIIDRSTCMVFDRHSVREKATGKKDDAEFQSIFYQVPRLPGSDIGSGTQPPYISVCV